MNDEGRGWIWKPAVQLRHDEMHTRRPFADSFRN